jgi:hypothetical protein
MGDTEIDSREQLFIKKDQLRDSINDLLDEWGVDMELESFHIQAKRARSCPPGYELVFEAVEHPDGSVTYQWVCKKP